MEELKAKAKQRGLWNLWMSSKYAFLTVVRYTVTDRRP
jgi:hypothetical protein